MLAGRVYCRRCASLLSEFPAARGLRRKPGMATRGLALVKRPAQLAGGAR